jgi:hypothetical protein
VRRVKTVMVVSVARDSAILYDTADGKSWDATTRSKTETRSQRMKRMPYLYITPTYVIADHLILQACRFFPCLHPSYK